MTQHLINDLTDRVGQLQMELIGMTWQRDRLQREATEARMRAQQAEAKLEALKHTDEGRRKLAANIWVGLREAGKTVEDLRDSLGECEAERTALADYLREYIWTHNDKAGQIQAAVQVQEIIDDARAEYRAQRKDQDGNSEKA